MEYTVVDAVHYAPHRLVDVRTNGSIIPVAHHAWLEIALEIADGRRRMID